VVAIAVRSSPVWRGDIGAAVVLVPLPRAEARERACDGVRGEVRV
jgi:hypothetical protein